MFSDVLNTMITSIQSGLSTINKKINDYTSSSIIGVILAAIASVIDELNSAISTAKDQAYLTTATDTDLDNKANDYGITRKAATFAKWTFVATKQSTSTSQITIPAGSLITTVPSPNQDAITFTIDSDKVLPVGSMNVNIPVTCETAGAIGNIATGVQLLWGSSVPGIDGVEFDDPTSGISGVDEETDDELRARALNAFKGLATSTSSWYQSTAESITGVESAKVVPQGRGVGTVDIYIVGQNDTIPDDTLISSVQTAIDAGRIITDDAKVFAPSAYTLDVTMDVYSTSGYDPTTTAASVQTAIMNYINSLGIGGEEANGTIYLSKLQAIALGVTGISNAPAPTAPTSDITFTSDQLPQAGTITINGHQA